MKHLIKISMAVLAAGLLLMSCEKSEPATGFVLDANEITIGADGGTETIKISSPGKWIASTEDPWLSVSPANGWGTVDCQVKIDTTLYADRLREGSVSFISRELNQELTLRVLQTGYEKMISMSVKEMDLPSYAERDKRSFIVEITSNVDFEINRPDSVQWIDNAKYSFELDRGSRPRTVKLNFKWDNNVRPWDRLAKIWFSPKSEDDDVAVDTLRVLQTKAAKIEDNREGDSLAIVACAREMNFRMSNYDGEHMGNWDFVTLWERTDKEAVEEDKVGRVRSVRFSQIETEESVPYEIQFLTKVETLSFYSNSKYFRGFYNTGEYLSKLTQLKNLQFFAYGLTELHESFVELKNLEVLDFTFNHFNEVPDILTPENFPKLRELTLLGNKRWTILDMTSTTYPRDEWGGLAGDFPEQLLKWDSLRVLNLSNNYIWGKIPDMAGYKTYTEEDLAKNDTLANILGQLKVLPAARVFRINLNMLEGDLPEWLLKHPNLMEWDPGTLVYNQEDQMYNLQGKLPGFENIPDSDEYWYQLFPLKDPLNQ